MFRAVEASRIVQSGHAHRLSSFHDPIERRVWSSGCGSPSRPLVQLVTAGVVN